MTTHTATVTGDGSAVGERPYFTAMSHGSLPCRDLEASKLFNSRVLGGEHFHEISGFVEYRLDDILFGLSEQADGWTGVDDEFPNIDEARAFARGSKQGGQLYNRLSRLELSMERLSAK